MTIPIYVTPSGQAGPIVITQGQGKPGVPGATGPAGPPMPTRSVAALSSSTEADGFTAFSPITGDIMVTIAGIWYSVPTLVNTDSATGSRIYVGSVAPVSPAPGDVWIN